MSGAAMISRLENDVDRRGLMLVLSSPSGAGKTTLTRLLREQEPSLTLSVSVTTRPRRPSEVEGVHYRFIDVETFKAMRERNELLEWAEVHGNFYGSPRKEVDRALASGQDILFDIDYQGAQQVRSNAPTDVVSVFILPPSIPEMKRRLERRAEDPPEMISRRLRTALGELERWREYDYVLVNDDLERCFDRLRAILVAERLRRERQLGLPAFTEQLMADLRATSA
ncbi:MAG: guanylate kinase [Alsobacter sp.]